MALLPNRIAPQIGTIIKSSLQSSPTAISPAATRNLAARIPSKSQSPLHLAQQPHFLSCHRRRRHFSTQSPGSPPPPAIKMTGQPLLELMEQRRTIYALNKISPVSDTRIQEIIKHAVKHVPSSFNSQSTRIILLVREEHDALWEIAKEAVRGVMPADKWPASEVKLNGFEAAYGTVSLAFLSYFFPF